MRPETEDQIERWAKYIKENPGKWKRIHTEFIDSQYRKSDEFYERLKKTKNGKSKIIRLFGIKNMKGYPSLIK